jgi:acyl carrier protein
MGLDTVELVMEIEDEFGFKMPDADAEVIQTCGQLCAYVLGRIGPPPEPCACPRGRCFYQLRRALMSQIPITKNAIRPSSRLADVMTEPYRPRWPAVAREIGLEDFYSFGRRCELFFPAVYTRLGDLARRISLSKPYDLPDTDDPFEQRVWQRIRQIISEQTAVPLHEIHPHSHFINDLNMD